MARSAISVYIVLFCLCSCATVPRSQNPEADTALAQANLSLDQINQRTQQFYTDFDVLWKDLTVFYSHPGWPDARKIVESFPYPEDDSEDPREDTVRANAKAEWTLKWKEPWEEMFTHYLELVKRCTALEVRRIALISDILGVQGRFLGVSVLEYSKGRYDQGRASDGIVEILARSSEELNSYSINSLGLYDTEPFEE
ncbi:MAG: hypothetical protein AB9873_19125 [Syntrophobacteraceae bacterium]